jgi:hypothetical protein
VEGKDSHKPYEVGGRAAGEARMGGYLEPLAKHTWARRGEVFRQL